MEISGKKSIQTLIEDHELHKYIRVIYLFKTQEYLINLCKQHKVNYEIKPKEFFDENYSNKTKYKYKYAIALLTKVPTLSLEELLKDKNPGIVVAADHLHDPFNLGGILRSCAATGVKAVIVPKDKQAPINHQVVLKASQGYALKIKVVEVSNLHQALLSLKKNGYWIYSTALNERAKNYREVEYYDKSVLVVGNEGFGVSQLIQKESDFLIYIPMKPGIDSLNVSVATGVVLFEMTKGKL